jgi:acylphosphatase
VAGGDSSKPVGKSVRVHIRGRVQGVWYRAWTAQEATKRGVRGWVRNRRDGSVEALFMGDAGAVDDLIEACRDGPELARVESIEVTADAGETLDGFEQRSSA